MDEQREFWVYPPRGYVFDHEPEWEELYRWDREIRLEDLIHVREVK